METHKISLHTIAHDGPVTSILYIPKSENLITGGGDQFMRIYRIDKGRLLGYVKVKLSSPLTSIIYMEGVEMMAAISENVTKIETSSCLSNC